MNLLIGYSGYVGLTLQSQIQFDSLANSKNLEDFIDSEFDLLVCAGLPAEKWRANNNPDQDFQNMCKLAKNISQISAKKAILISTVDVFSNPLKKYEDQLTDLDNLAAYGRNRAWFEVFFKERFHDHLVVRLPGLFSSKMKKNLFFDLMQDKAEEYNKVSANSRFQFFNLENLAELLVQAQLHDLRVLHVASEPVYASEVAELFKKKLPEEGQTVNYDMRTKYDLEFGGSNGYIYSKELILAEMLKLKENF
jgi:dTDP-4-dehydrorhamnose reductase